MTLQCVPLESKHLSDVYRIECLAHTHPWSEKLIYDIGARGAFQYVLLDKNRVIGYFYAQNVVGEVTLLNIAVEPASQGKGGGKRLLQQLLICCQKSKADSIWLEVRDSNRRAFSLYEALGFNEVDRRMDYYPTSNGKEDAIIMSFVLF